MADLLLGTCHPGRSAYDAMSDVGLNSIRLDVPFPFADRNMSLSDAFKGTSDWVDEMLEHGFEPLGITPYPEAVPTWRGAPGTEGYFGLVAEAVQFVGEHFEGKIDVWQCTNEMNVAHFRRPLTPDDAVRFVKESALGLKLASDYLTVGANMGGFSEQAKTMYEQLYESDVSWDYIGTDGYFGTWEEGGPHTWHTALDWLVELTPLPVYAMEWGYSSAGKIMPPEKVIPDNTDPHAEGMWCFGWDDDGTVKSHDFEVQALYIEQTMAILADRVAGIFYYCWRDSQSCACGNEGCPVEANWGLVDTNGDPKPSYHALKRCIAELDD